MFLHRSKIQNLLRGFLVRQGNGKGEGKEEETANDQIYTLTNMSW